MISQEIFKMEGQCFPPCGSWVHHFSMSFLCICISAALSPCVIFALPVFISVFMCPGHGFNYYLYANNSPCIIGQSSKLFNTCLTSSQGYFAPSHQMQLRLCPNIFLVCYVISNEEMNVTTFIVVSCLSFLPFSIHSGFFCVVTVESKMYKMKSFQEAQRQFQIPNDWAIPYHAIIGDLTRCYWSIWKGCLAQTSSIR